MNNQKRKPRLSFKKRLYLSHNLGETNDRCISKWNRELEELRNAIKQLSKRKDKKPDDYIKLIELIEKGEEFKVKIKDYVKQNDINFNERLLSFSKPDYIDKIQIINEFLQLKVDFMGDVEEWAKVRSITLNNEIIIKLKSEKEEFRHWLTLIWEDATRKSNLLAIDTPSRDSNVIERKQKNEFEKIIKSKLTKDSDFFGAYPSCLFDLVGAKETSLLKVIFCFNPDLEKELQNVKDKIRTVNSSQITYLELVKLKTAVNEINKKLNSALFPPPYIDWLKYTETPKGYAETTRKLHKEIMSYSEG